MSTKTQTGTTDDSMDEVDCIIADLERALEPVLRNLKKAAKDKIWEEIHQAFDDVIDILTGREEDEEIIAEEPKTIQPVGTPFPSAKDILYTA